jgi:hypothetical protein
MELIHGPAVEDRDRRPTLGIRTIAPFRGMLAVRDKLEAELMTGLARLGQSKAGPIFLRLHVIDMQGEMDIEVGSVVPAGTEGDDRLLPGELPAGRYATLTYRDQSLAANRMLLDWVAAQNITLDRYAVAKGDLFACRCEIWATDPRNEPRKKQRAVQLDFLTKT